MRMLLSLTSGPFSPFVRTSLFLASIPWVFKHHLETEFSQIANSGSDLSVAPRMGSYTVFTSNLACTKRDSWSPSTFTPMLGNQVSLSISVYLLLSRCEWSLLAILPTLWWTDFCFPGAWDPTTLYSRLCRCLPSPPQHLLFNLLNFISFSFFFPGSFLFLLLKIDLFQTIYSD